MSPRRPLRLESLELRRLLATTTIDAEPNDTPALAQTFEFGDDGVAILQGTSANKTDKDFFRFTAPADGQLQASLTNRGTSLEIDDLLEIEPHDGQTTGTAFVLAGHSYYVRLRGESSAASDYEATLTFTAGEVPPGTGGGDDHGDDDDHDDDHHDGDGHEDDDDHDDDHSGDDHDDDDEHGGGTPPTTEDPAAVVVTDAEPNNSRGASQRFELAGSMRLEGTAAPGDRDFFAFTVAEDGSYTIGVRSLNGGKVELEIEDQLGHDVLELEPHDGIHSGVAALVAGRTYFLRVKAEGLASTDYAVDLQPAAPVDPPADVPVDPPLQLAAAKQAAINQFDTDGDDVVAPLDALGILIYLNGREGGEGEPSLLELVYDVNDDGQAGPLDALQVINYLNSGANLPSTGIDAPVTVPPVTTPDNPVDPPLVIPPPVDTLPADPPPVDPPSDDPPEHDLNDDHGVDPQPELDDSSHDGDCDDHDDDDHDDDDEHGSDDDEDDDDDYTRGVDAAFAEYEHEHSRS